MAQVVWDVSGEISTDNLLLSPEVWDVWSKHGREVREGGQGSRGGRGTSEPRSLSMRADPGPPDTEPSILCELRWSPGL